MYQQIYKLRNACIKENENRLSRIACSGFAYDQDEIFRISIPTPKTFPMSISFSMTSHEYSEFVLYIYIYETRKRKGN